MKTYRQRLGTIFLFMGIGYVILAATGLMGAGWGFWYTMGMGFVGFGIGSLIQRRKAK